MPFTLTMPKLSPTMETGTIAKWHKKVGDRIEVGDLLIEVSTDKATVEHESLEEGWLRKIVVAEGKSAQINEPIAIFTESENESIDGYEIKKEIFEVKSEGDETKKEEPATASSKKNEPIKTGILGHPSFIPEPPLEKYRREETVFAELKASPFAKKLAAERNLDLSAVKGSGPGGRIVSEDLEQAPFKGVVGFGKRKTPSEIPGSYEEEPLNPVRKVISQRLQEAKTFIPHFYVSQTVLADPLAAVKEQLHAGGITLTYNDFVTRACALALREHPGVNSGFNNVTQAVVLFKTIDISIAVNTKEGLITPIIRHADFKNIGEISTETRTLAKKARDGKLALQAFKGGSFTISNLGMYGITNFQAIINPPQAAILAVGGIQNVPLIKNGEVVAGKCMHLTLSVDHRVIDGVIAAEFIKTIQKYLENPSILLV